ncbi:beta-ketoacyl-[acyl-carrier-protein] synthase family protein [Streptosporangiaceae bacterium NEAU-GS5]|nr:beta-ketoacyl-[acyl-carrier-protein] synthase family protein [Streptosporangiaceae bacterium NEAU-GS5]
MRRVVVTGVGLLTGLGVGTKETWEGLLEGRSAIGPVTNFDASSLRSRLAAEITGFDPMEFIDRRALRKMTRNEQLSVVGATLAVRDAGMEGREFDGERTGLFTGSSKEVSDLAKLVDAVVESTDDEGRFDVRKAGERSGRFHPLYYVEGLQGASLFYISAAFGLKGVNTYFAGTSEAGMSAIGRAFRAVRRGEADVAIAGGFDDPVWWWAMSSFDSLGMLTDRNDLGAAAFRPYDKDASGAVLGEGAAFLVLEEYEVAQRRGARAYAEVTGYGSAADAYKLLTPHPDGRGLVHALNKALRDAKAGPDDFTYVAAHGSATPQGDVSEARALRAVFPADPPVASSVKPATGHLVGGAGALNVAVAALAVHDQAVPPTLNLDDPQPDCAFDWVPRAARELPVRGALAVARGLEGQNAVLALRPV